MRARWRCRPGRSRCALAEHSRAPTTTSRRHRDRVRARRRALSRPTPRGKGETEIATLPAKAHRARAAHRRARQGPARRHRRHVVVDAARRLDEDADRSAVRRRPRAARRGRRVRAVPQGATGLAHRQPRDRQGHAVDVPAPGARLAGTGAERKLVWADAQARLDRIRRGDAEAATKVAPEAPLRSLLPSPDGTHALGVYADEVFEDRASKKPAEVLMVFALDGQGARRKAIQNGVPVEWSHDCAVGARPGRRERVHHARGGRPVQMLARLHRRLDLARRQVRADARSARQEAARRRRRASSPKDKQGHGSCRSRRRPDEPTRARGRGRGGAGRRCRDRPRRRVRSRSTARSSRARSRPRRS